MAFFSSHRFYIWRTVQDAKVRSAHAHADRDGHVFSWEIEPNGGHPGADYNCRCWAETVTFKNTGAARKNALLGKEPADFFISENKNANEFTPVYALKAQSQIRKYESIISAESRKAGIDPDLVRAVIYLETT